MTDKQVFVALLGGLLSAILGGALLTILIQLLYQVAGRHIDGGDDSWGMLWMVLMILSGTVGSLLSAKWALKRFPATAP